MRQLTVYEKSHLLKHKILPEDLSTVEDRPVEYITGQAEFFGRLFAVNPHVLIPRIETEEIIELAVDRVTGIYPDHKSPLAIIDVGTGSGCIGITLYMELRSLGYKSKVYLSDISKEALDLAATNIVKFNIPLENFVLHHSNLLTGFADRPIFDLIVANLPYIPSHQISDLPESVKNFEPLLALEGGLNGQALINRLIIQAKNRLKLKGGLILEIDSGHTLDDFAEFKKDWKMEIRKDKFGRNRFLILTAKS